MAPSGILNIDKPPGVTSHDVINQVRKIIGIRKVGHAGTLDPMATGVLLICVGQATRLVEYLVKQTKQYRATVKFGVATNTYDADGQVTSTADPANLTKAVVEQALRAFVGHISQVPPPFSAIKRDGVPLYKRARRGEIVEVEPRNVQINTINLIEWQLPEMIIDIRCQSGTYIRSIAHDLGQTLGFGAHLTALIRTASGNWHVDQAISLTQLKEAVSQNALPTVLQPMEQAIGHMSQISLSEEQAKAIRFGQSIPYDTPVQEPLIAGLDDNGYLVALLHADKTGILKPKKVFHN